MTRKEIKDNIFRRLAEELKSYDFKFIKKEDCFIRKYSWGNHLLAVPFYDYNPEYIFSLVTCIRLNEVEDIFNNFSGTLPAYQSQTSTVMINLGYFYGKEKVEYKVKNENDIQNALDELMVIIKGKILNFLEETSNIKSLHQALSKNEKLDCTLPPASYMSRLILAKINNDNFNQLADRYEKAIGSFVPMEKEKLLNLIAFLKLNS